MSTLQSNATGNLLSPRSFHNNSSLHWTPERCYKLCQLYYCVGPGSTPKGSWNAVVGGMSKTLEACKKTARVLKLPPPWTPAKSSLLERVCKESPKNNGVIEDCTWKVLAKKVGRHWIVCKAYAEHVGYVSADIGIIDAPFLDWEQGPIIDETILDNPPIEKKKYISWEFEDDKRLFNYYRSRNHQTWDQFAATINRSLDGCKSRVNLLGLKTQWTSIENNLLRQSCENSLQESDFITDASWKKIAKVVQHHWVTCKLQAEHLEYVPSSAITH